MNDPSTPPAHLEVDEHAPDRNLALELVRVTEAAAMAAGRWVGIGGTPEGIIAACAMKCMGGMIQGKLRPKDDELLRGVRYRSSIARTHSLVMRSRSGTIRSIESGHQLSKLLAYAAIDFEHAR